MAAKKKVAKKKVAPKVEAPKVEKKIEPVKEVKAVSQNKTETRLSYLERVVGKCVKFLEDVHGADVDSDGKVGSTKIGTMLISCAFALILGVSAVFADNIDSKSLGTGTYSLDRASVNTGLITLTVDAIAADITGDTVSTLDTVTPTALSGVTNAQVLTIAKSVYVITPTGGANDTTNTVTIANATASGQYVELHVAAGATNLLGLANSGNLNLTAAWVGDETDNIILRSISTNWYEIGRSDN